MTTNDGTPKRVTKKPLSRPIAAPVARPAQIAGTGPQPCLTLSTAMTAAARPLTAPTDRSISPSSRISTMPIEIVPTAAICSTRFVRLNDVRKRSFWVWKMIQISARTNATRSEPSCARRSASVARGVSGASGAAGDAGAGGVVVVMASPRPHSRGRWHSRASP